MTATQKTTKAKPLPMLVIDVCIQDRAARLAEVTKELQAVTALHSEHAINLPAIEQKFEAKTADREALKATEQELEKELIEAASKNGDMDAISARSVAVSNELAALDKQIMHLGAALAKLRLQVSETKTKKRGLEWSERSMKTALEEAYFQKRYCEFVVNALDDFSEHVINEFIKSHFAHLHYVRAQMAPFVPKEDPANVPPAPNAAMDAFNAAFPAQPGIANPSGESLVYFGSRKSDGSADAPDALKAEPGAAIDDGAQAAKGAPVQAAAQASGPGVDDVILGEGLPESVE